MPILDNSFFRSLGGFCTKLVQFIPLWALLPAAIILGLFLASLKKLTQGQDQKDLAQWLLDTSTLCTTITIAIIGWKLTDQQDEHNKKVREETMLRHKCDMLLDMWAANCDRAVVTIERQLYSIPGHGYLLNLVGAEAPELEKAKMLAFKALALVGEDGQPTDHKLHCAKQALNRWAESVDHYMTEEDVKALSKLGYDGLFKRCALFYLYFAEPFNWAWHIHHMATRHTETAADVLERLKAHKRLSQMVALADVDVLSQRAVFIGTPEWTKPFKAFYVHMMMYWGEVVRPNRSVFFYTFTELTRNLRPLSQELPPRLQLQEIPPGWDNERDYLSHLYTDLQKRAVGEVPSNH